MLILSRKQEEEILIGDNIKIKVLRINRNAVKIGIDAPRDVYISRPEVKDKYFAPNNEGGEASS